MYGGFVERATAVQHLLADERTSFFVVSSSEMVPLREAEFFATELEKRKLDIGAVVLNKVLPKTLSDPKVNKIAQKMEAKRSEIITQLVAKLGCDETVLSRVLDAVGESFDDFAVVARRESVSRAKFPRGNADLVTVPFFDHDITDMAGLLELGESLLGTNKQI
jgi:anion-transporting  ArsA/GET3 family ATPase